MMEIRNPFSMREKEKDLYMTRELRMLTDYHREHCRVYADILAAAGYDNGAGITHYSELPFLPVTLFKKLVLSSLEEGQEDYKIMTSSGTGGQVKSQIILDADTRIRQQQALADRIVPAGQTLDF